MVVCSLERELDMQFELIRVLLEKLFEAEKRRLANVINELNTSNKRLKNIKVDGFLYGGTFYLPSGVSIVVAGVTQAKAMLHPALSREMDVWVQDQKNIHSDQDLIRQMLFRLLKPCRSDRENRNALPECLVCLVSDLAKHPRSDSAGYTLRGDERASRQFDKLLSKMEVYSAARLLY
jgi:hypothetical protein